MSWKLPLRKRLAAQTIGSAMKKKNFKLKAPEIRPLAENHGACFATDMITVDGRPVGLMYREPPDNEVDSGWRFLTGEESQEYLDDPDNHSIYDVNTIANYDPDIIPFLNSPVGSAFERDHKTGKFVETDSPADE